ncbi:MAG: 4Fe-4S binding protein [Bacillota bacterium]
MQNNKIVIDQEKCIGCGICAKTCQQSAIEMRNGKATVVSNNTCDGIGNCLPVCPVGAITFYKEETPTKVTTTISNCQGTQPTKTAKQWPIQLQLVPTEAPYFADCDLLVAADCTAFAYRNFHSELMSNHAVVIGCPKLDLASYTEKLAEILKNNTVRTVKTLRMQVPCCGGIEKITNDALAKCGKALLHEVVTISTDGKMI